MNWIIIIIFGVAVIALLYFLFKTNQKDEETYEKEVNDEYPKPKERIKDIDIDDTMH